MRHQRHRAGRNCHGEMQPNKRKHEVLNPANNFAVAPNIFDTLKFRFLAYWLYTLVCNSVIVIVFVIVYISTDSRA